MEADRFDDDVWRVAGLVGCQLPQCLQGVNLFEVDGLKAWQLGLQGAQTGTCTGRHRGQIA